MSRRILDEVDDDVVDDLDLDDEEGIVSPPTDRETSAAKRWNQQRK